MRLIALALLLVACHPDADAPPSMSGVRLRARYITATDGAREFSGWWDSQREEVCSFQEKLSPGVLRCVPFIVELFWTGSYADPGCSVRLYDFQGMSLGREPETDTFHAAGSLHTGPVYITNDATCVTGPPVVGLAPLGAIVDPADFEPAEIVTE